jgi:hypothetical protein
LRLLLDEMYPAVLAEQLRRRGSDVSAVAERPELRSLSDADVFAACQRERRALVTENIADFVPIADGADQRGETHFGLVLIDPVKDPRGRRRTIGRLVTSLDRILREHPRDRATSLRYWP